MTVTIHLGDCVKWAQAYSGEPFHALLCDPPYEMSFMGKHWDNQGTAFDPATWEAFGRILYPGAFGMAFASSRGWHRMAVAIEDAGFIIHPSIFGWAYGSGFPKATRVDTQIDKEAGAEREEVGFAPNTKGRLSSIHRESQSLGPGWSGKQTAPATPLAAAFAGHRYGLQALKPALEPIIVFQKPYVGRPIDNITATGAGVLAIDAARIGLADGEECKPMKAQGKVNSIIGQSGRYEDTTELKAGGRWPANFLLLDAEAAARLDAQSGTLKGGGRSTNPNGFGGLTTGKFGPSGEGLDLDKGGYPSRFFFRVSEQLDDADPVRYVAKASRRERDAGLDGMPMHDVGDAGRHTMSGDMPRNYTAKDGIGRTLPRHNVHPTIKPLSLTRYLATLLLPPAEFAPRRLFVPFAGVASECIGAMQAGWEDVQGVELTEEYIPIAQARVAYWRDKPRQMELDGGAA